MCVCVCAHMCVFCIKFCIYTVPVVFKISAMQRYMLKGYVKCIKVQTVYIEWVAVKELLWGSAKIP